MPRCTLCHTLLSPTDARITCPECATEYHRTCWDELGGCGTYGCRQAPAPQKSPPPALVGAGWGDSKECPACAQPINSSLLVCRCGARFPWAEAMTRAEYLAYATEERALRGAKITILLLFIGTLLGVTAPVCGAAAGVYGHRKRKRLTGPAGTYLALAYGSGALGVAYAAIMLLLAVGR